LSSKPLDQIIRHLVDEIRYRDELARLYPDTNDRDARWASVEELVNSAAAYARKGKKATLAGFLQDIMLTTTDDDKQSQLEKNAVALMTLHAAKGLEFPEVYMVGMEEGILPHHRSVGDNEAAIDEERRLCYVGVTRAEKRLTLALALSRNKWGKPRPTQPSRFLYELIGKADNPNYAKAQAHLRREGGPGKKKPIAKEQTARGGRTEKSPPKTRERRKL
jgi:DNA helicase-2/ATP-dependent DNA helicase PcrA